MQLTETIQCPFCGQTFELEIDVTIPQQSFVTDCEICCRPMDVRVTCEAGSVSDLSVQ
jgi:transcription elongation factor Elf1